METFHATQAGEFESTRAHWSQWDNSSDAESVIDNNLITYKAPGKEQKQERPSIKFEEERESEYSGGILDKVSNPLVSLYRYLYSSGDASKTAQQLESQLEYNQNISPITRLLANIKSMVTFKNISMLALLFLVGAGYKAGIKRLKILSKHHDKLNTILSIWLAMFFLMQNKSKFKNYTYIYGFWEQVEKLSKLLEKGKVIKKVKKLEVEFYELALFNFAFRFSLKVKVCRKDKAPKHI